MGEEQDDDAAYAKPADAHAALQGGYWGIFRIATKKTTSFGAFEVDELITTCPYHTHAPTNVWDWKPQCERLLSCFMTDCCLASHPLGIV